MNILFIVLGIIIGTAIAWILNKIFAGKIADKNQRIGLKTASYIVCIILCITFAVFGSLRIILNNFLENRIAYIEVELTDLFPDSNILEMTIDTDELASVVDEVQQTVNNINTSADSFFEKLVFGAFLHKLTGYVYTAEDSINSIKTMRNENGLVTVKSVLYGLKDMTLETISPYFIFGQIGALILLAVYIGIYAGIVVYIKKGGVMYNKSIVFGDAANKAD